jgi:hypothetical protein
MAAIQRMMDEDRKSTPLKALQVSANPLTLVQEQSDAGCLPLL